MEPNFAPQPQKTTGIIAVAALTGAAVSTAEILPGSMMPLMASGLHTSEGIIGQATTANAIIAIITSLCMAQIVGDRDRKAMMVGVIGLLVLSNACIVLAPNVWVMLAARLLLGFTIGIFWGLLPGILLRISGPARFASVFSMVIAGSSISGVAGAPSAALIGSWIGWRWVYVAASVLSITAFLALLKVFPSFPATGGGPRRDLLGTLRLPGLIAGMIGIMFMFGGSQAFYGYLVPYLEFVVGLSAGSVSMALLVFGISGVVGTMIVPHMIRRSLHGVLVTAPLVLALLLGVMLLTGGGLLITIGILLLWSLARSHVGIPSNAWVAHHYADHMESASGILVAVIQSSMMLGAIIGGVLIDTRGPKAPPLAAMTILAIGSVYIYFAMKPKSAGPAIELVVPVAENNVVVVESESA